MVMEFRRAGGALLRSQSSILSIYHSSSIHRPCRVLQPRMPVPNQYDSIFVVPGHLNTFGTTTRHRQQAAATARPVESERDSRDSPQSSPRQAREGPKVNADANTFSRPSSSSQSNLSSFLDSTLDFTNKPTSTSRSRTSRFSSPQGQSENRTAKPQLRSTSPLSRARSNAVEEAGVRGQGDFPVKRNSISDLNDYEASPSGRRSLNLDRMFPLRAPTTTPRLCPGRTTCEKCQCTRYPLDTCDWPNH